MYFFIYKEKTIIIQVIQISNKSPLRAFKSTHRLNIYLLPHEKKQKFVLLSEEV